MYGRERERAAVVRLLAEAWDGHSGAVAFRGDPGVGKSALLSHAATAAAGMRVLRCNGVGTEVNLPFAGLHQLLRPVLGLAQELPAPQARALEGAFGLAAPPKDIDGFLVAVAVLSLLAEAGARGPVLCLIDDAHWLDRSSLDALSFAARRLDGEGVVLLGATREDAPAGFTPFELEGLDRKAAGDLLEATAPELPEELRARLLSEAAGNPLALLELAPTLKDAGPTGPLPLTRRLQEAFSWQIRELPEPTRRLLLVAAADDTGQTGTVVVAGRELGLPADAIEPAEEAGLLRLDDHGGLAFRHPLVRAAAYHEAPREQRRAAHRALADTARGQADRRAWHQAAAASGPDEAVAAELERLAGLAIRRGAPATASITLERAAELSGTASSGARRMAAAAWSAYHAGRFDRAAAIITRARTADDDVVLARVLGLRGVIEQARGSAATAHALLLDAAKLLAVPRPNLAVRSLVEATRVAIQTGDRNTAQIVDTFSTVKLRSGHPYEPVVTAHAGLGRFCAGDVAEGVAQMRQGLDALAQDAESGRIDGYPERFYIIPHLAIASGNLAAGITIARAAVQSSRSLGIASRLPIALAALAYLEMLAGRPLAARILASEAIGLFRDLDHRQGVAFCEGLIFSWLAAIAGDEDACRQLIRRATRASQERQLTTMTEGIGRSLGMLDLSLGRPEPSLHRHLEVHRSGASSRITRLLAVPDLIEAAARTGDLDLARRPLGEFERWVSATRERWAHAVLLRSRALVAGDDTAEELFRAAQRVHEEIGPHDHAFDRARTQLLYGQWLRRSLRKGDARVVLNAARETFERVQATAWARRATTELRATGVRMAPSRACDGIALLTSQERQVVRLAAAGHSNRDIGAQLFISPRTVAYHLYKAFPKLQVASRRELAHLDLNDLD